MEAIEELLVLRFSEVQLQGCRGVCWAEGRKKMS